MFGLGTLACHLRYALIIILVIVVVILLSKWTGTSGGRSTTAFILKGGNKSGAAASGTGNGTGTSLVALQRLMKETQEWAHETEQSTITPIGQLINSTYALAYAQATQAVASAPEIKTATSVDVEPLVASMKAKQTEAVQYLARNFPSIV